MLAYFKAMVNRSDEPSLLRIINTPPRGIGQTTVKRLMDEAARTGKPLWDVLARVGETDGLTYAARSAARTIPPP